MTPLRRLAALVLAVVAVGACGSSSGVAASVDGRRITHRDVVAELEAIRDNEPYVEAVEGAGASVLGSSEGAFDAAFVATQLGVRIQYAIVSNEIARRDLSPDDACRQAARDSIVQNLAPASPTGDGAAILEGFAPGYRDYLVDREADLLLLQGTLVGQPCLSDDALAAYYEEHRDEFEQACASHILVDTAAEAAEIVTLLRGGADFAALATERSTDAGSAAQGGSLGCLTRGSTVPEFDAAAFSQPLGEVGDPVETDFGFHVIRVDSRDVPSLDDARNEVAQALVSEVREAFVTWYTEAVADAEVGVDPRYGRWDADTSSIVRPGAGGDRPEPAATTEPTGG